MSLAHLDCMACRISLRGCGSIRDGAVRALAALPRLEYLDVSKCKHISDAATDALQGMTRLREVFLGCTGITPAGLERLQAATGLQHASLCCGHLKAV